MKKTTPRFDTRSGDQRVATGFAMIIISVLAVLLLGGCTRVRLQADNQQFDNATIVAGRVVAAPGEYGLEVDAPGHQRAIGTYHVEAGVPTRTTPIRLRRASPMKALSPSTPRTIR